MTDEPIDETADEQTATLGEAEAAIDDRLDALEAQAGDLNTDDDDLSATNDFGEDLHAAAVAIDSNLYLVRRDRDGDLEVEHGYTTEEVDDHIDALSALRERLTALAADAPVDVTIETEAGYTETTVTADAGLSTWTVSWDSAYGAQTDPHPVPVTFDDETAEGW